MRLKILCSTCLILLSLFTFGQVEMADTFRSEGKIYVVVAVILLILLSLIIIMFRVEQKVSKLEKEINNRK